MSSNVKRLLVEKREGYPPDVSITHIACSSL